MLHATAVSYPWGWLWLVCGSTIEYRRSASKGGHICSIPVPLKTVETVCAGDVEQSNADNGGLAGPGCKAAADAAKVSLSVLDVSNWLMGLYMEWGGAVSVDAHNVVVNVGNEPALHFVGVSWLARMLNFPVLDKRRVLKNGIERQVDPACLVATFSPLVLVTRLLTISLHDAVQRAFNLFLVLGS